ncbi:hypothetical protein DFH06DRAFT_1323006 [Mycena polygramma]|nr:hypothetical protein DFH06DRAFT_1323006 [Mycena polygramma]
MLRRCLRVLDVVAKPEVVLSLELWAKSMLYVVHNVLLSLVEAANAHAAIACVSKTWKHRVYTIAEFWSYITITRNLSMDHLSFVLSKCTAGTIHIRLIFRSIRIVCGIPATVNNVAVLVDSIFKRISPFFHRRKSFKLITENSIVFYRCHTRYSDIRANALEQLKLSYFYLPGFTEYIRAHGLHDLLFKDPINMCTSLQVVELFDFTCATCLDPDTLSILFKEAMISKKINDHMRVLHLGLISPFTIPSDYYLRSPSLQMLDIEFFRASFVGCLLQAMDLPGLVELAVRQVYHSINLLLVCSPLLEQLTTFTVHNDIGDDLCLGMLLDSMPCLQHLDLSSSFPHVFDWYCTWAYSVMRRKKCSLATNLKSLTLGRVPISSVVELV